VPSLVLSFFFFAAGFVNHSELGNSACLLFLLVNREQNDVAGDILSSAVAALKVEHLAGIIILKDLRP
jgi:hypothetical protein